MNIAVVGVSAVCIKWGVSDNKLMSSDSSLLPGLVLCGGGDSIPWKNSKFWHAEQHTSTLQRWIIFAQTMETKGFFQFEIVINVLVSSSRFIWILMLLIYGH